eukprot:7057749-Pyramimonas_sp.AAC.1
MCGPLCNQSQTQATAAATGGAAAATILIIITIIPVAFLARTVLSMISFPRECAAPTAHLNAWTC